MNQWKNKIINKCTEINFKKDSEKIKNIFFEAFNELGEREDLIGELNIEYKENEELKSIIEINNSYKYILKIERDCISIKEKFNGKKIGYVSYDIDNREDDYICSYYNEKEDKANKELAINDEGYDISEHLFDDYKEFDVCKFKYEDIINKLMNMLLN